MIVRKILGHNIIRLAAAGFCFIAFALGGIFYLNAAEPPSPKPSKSAQETADQYLPSPDELLAQKALEKKKREQARKELKTEEEITREWQAQRHWGDFEPVEGFRQDVSDSRRE